MGDAGRLSGRCFLPKPEEDDSLSDIEPDVCDVTDVFPVCRETGAVEPLRFPVVIPMRSQGGCDPVLSLPRYRGGNNREVIVSGRESIVEMLDVNCGICMEPDFLPVVISTDDVEPVAVPVVALTRSRVEGPLVVARPMNVIISGRESTVEMLDVNHGICMELDLLPVVMADGVEPLAVPVVALKRSWGEEPLVVARPMNVDAISRAAVYPDLLSGGVIKLVDPDVGSGDPMSLKTIPGLDGDACQTEWREMVLDDIVMEKFVLVPEVCPVGSMTSVAEPTFLPALSEVYSPGG